MFYQRKFPLSPANMGLNMEPKWGTCHHHTTFLMGWWKIHFVILYFLYITASIWPSSKIVKNVGIAMTKCLVDWEQKMYTSLASLMLKVQQIFPTFVGRKLMVKLLALWGVMFICWLRLLASNLIQPTVKLLGLICFSLRNTLKFVIIICFQAASPGEGP